MVRNPDKQARAEAILGELAELGLMVARELAIRARETEDHEQAVALTGALQKMTRTVRLTLALDAKLDRDAARDAAAEVREARDVEAHAQAEAKRNAPTDYDRRQADPIEARKTRVCGLLNRLIWRESEGDEDEYRMLSDDLDARLDEAGRIPGFVDLPIETLVRRMVADMGLTGTFVITLAEPESVAAPEPVSADTG